MTANNKFSSVRLGTPPRVNEITGFFKGRRLSRRYERGI